MKLIWIKILLLFFISCEEKNKEIIQDFVNEDYLAKICERTQNNWNVSREANELILIKNDSIKSSKVPFPPNFLQGNIKENDLKKALDLNMIDTNDLQYFLNSKNKNYRKDLRSLNIKCSGNLYHYIDGRDPETSFYSQPFYSEDRKVLIFREGLNFYSKTQINLICINNRKHKTFILPIHTFTKDVAPPPSKNQK